MTEPLGSVEALLAPDHRIIIVAGCGRRVPLHLPVAARALCYAGDDILYLLSGSGSYHRARVVLESWAAAPPDDDRGYAYARQQVTLALSDGT